MNLDLAAPMIIPPTSFDISALVDEAQNKLWLKSLRKKIVKVAGYLPSIAGARTPVYKTGNGQQGYYFVEYDNKTVVLVQYQRSKIKKLNNLPVITQIALWKDDDFSVPADFSSRLFFDVVLADNGALLSDKKQTEYGMRFWKRRLIEALDKDKAVYFWNANKGSVQRINSIVELQTMYRVSWSSEKAAAKLRWIVVN